MSRIAMLVMGASLSLGACAHDDATPDAKTPLGATELQTTSAPSSTPDTRTAVVTHPVPATDHTVLPAPTGNPPPPATAAPPTDVTASNSRPDADNTRVNVRDRGGANVTPMDQGNNATDLGITQTIRKAVMADGTLSFTAKNVKIITSGAKVVLRGPVKSAQERASIEAMARATAGVTDVDDQLEVKQ
jgi:hypothetical protein